MYSSIQSTSLVKSTCGCTKGHPYTPSTTNAMDVSFHPVMNDSGTQNYLALIDSNDNVKIPSYMKISDSNDSLDSLDSKNDSKNDVFNTENDYIKTFYIGSITVVGLYILFRILDKSR